MICGFPYMGVPLKRLVFEGDFPIEMEDEQGSPMTLDPSNFMKKWGLR